MNDKIAIIPQPQSLTVATGVPFHLHAATEISGAGSKREAAHLRERIALLTGLDLLVQPGGRAGSGRIVLQCDFAAERHESYSLIVSEKQVRLAATHPAGLFYGCQTLVQLLQPVGDAWHIPVVHIEAATACHDVVMSPTTHTYLDCIQSDDRAGEPPGATYEGALTLEKKPDGRRAAEQTGSCIRGDKPTSGPNTCQSRLWLNT